jgi:hypothetical protein
MSDDVSPPSCPSRLRGEKLERSREYGPGAVTGGFFYNVIVQGIALGNGPKAGGGTRRIDAAS